MMNTPIRILVNESTRRRKINTGMSRVCMPSPAGCPIGRIGEEEMQCDALDDMFQAREIIKYKSQ